MKKLLYAVLLLLLCQQAQAQATTPPPAARPATTPSADERSYDTVLIAVTDTPENAWRQLAQVLLRRGYVIEHSDKDLLTMTTYPLRKGLKACRVSGAVVGRELSLRMYQVLAPETEVSPRNQVNRGGGNSASWQELEAIGQQMGGTVRYTVSAAPQ
jgi:hypothetical protein